MKLVSTSEAQQKEGKQKVKHAKNDPIEKLKAKVYVKEDSNIIGKRKNSGNLNDLENSVFAKLKARKQTKAL